MIRWVSCLSAASLALGLTACSGVGGDESGDAALVAEGMDPLANEVIGKSEDLKGAYGSEWFFAHDLNFNTLGRGKIMVIDAMAENKNYRGAIDADQFASFRQSASRGELYVAETFYSRGMRGTRTDVVTIYEQETLNVLGEVVLPQSNRAMNVTQKSALDLTRNGKFLLVYTFTPATGVAVIDLETRRLVNEIDTAGCILAYPSGEQGFASLCGDGTMMAYQLDDQGQVASNELSVSFNDIDNNPIFMKSATIGDITYFPTFEGYLQGVRLGDKAPEPLEIWHFAKDTDRKPSGWQVITSDKQGLIYVLMRPGAKTGDHKYGGSEVWVLDPNKREIVRKVELAEESLSIEVSKGDTPFMLVTSLTMNLDVYDLSNDSRVRSVGGVMSSTPFVLHAVEMGQ